MKKYFVLLMMVLVAASCSKTVEIKGKVTGGSPLERIELVEASGVATLPLINIGVDKDGNFNGKFDAPKNGMYVISYAGRQNLIYLKKGQNIEISGNSESFPAEYTVTGDAKANNDFLAETQKYMAEYSQKLDMQASIAKEGNGFLKDLKKIQTDLEKNIDQVSEKTKADSEVVTWKKNDIRTGIMSLIPQYEMYQKQMGTNPSFTLPKVLKDYEDQLQENKEQLIKEHPLYRNYLLSKLTDDYQTYAMANTQGKIDVLTSQVFSDFLKQRKDLSQTAKDYLLAFVMAQRDISPDQSKENNDKIAKLIDSEIKDGTVKKDLKKIHSVLSGLKRGEVAPEVALVKQDGKTYKISESKGKPTVMMFYASWSPYIAESTVPVLKEVVDFYKQKVNFVFVNFDDTKDQFSKTSAALLKGIPGTNVYAEGGLNSKFAEKYGVYGFKLAPSFLVLDKDGKIASKIFYNLGESEFVSIMDQLSGLKAPQVAPEATLQNDLLVPKEQQEAPVPQNTP